MRRNRSRGSGTELDNLQCLGRNCYWTVDPPLSSPPGSTLTIKIFSHSRPKKHHDPFLEVRNISCPTYPFLFPVLLHSFPLTCCFFSSSLVSSFSFFHFPPSLLPFPLPSFFFCLLPLFYSLSFHNIICLIFRHLKIFKFSFSVIDFQFNSIG